jgi:hypothetical protein
MKTALARLRAKTDQDLSILVARQLNRSLAQAQRQDYAEAARGYQLARKVLAVTDIPSAQRDKLELKLSELRSHLELPATAVA